MLQSCSASPHKDNVLTIQQSMVYINTLCHCDWQYVGQTTLRLQDRFNHHIPKSICNNKQSIKIISKCKCKENAKTSKVQKCDSVIGLHLQNKDCANNYNDQQVSILSRTRSTFHLSALEATCIKTLKTFLCCQKEFIYLLQISH